MNPSQGEPSATAKNRLAATERARQAGFAKVMPKGVLRHEANTNYVLTLHLILELLGSIWKRQTEQNIYRCYRMLVWTWKN